MKKKRALLHYAVNEKGFLAVPLLLTLIVIVMQLIKPQITRIFLDKVMLGEVDSKLMLMALGFMALTFGIQLLHVFCSYFSQKFAWRIIKKIRSSLFKHCLNLDMKYHNEHNEGELLERIDGDVSQVFVLYSQILFSILGNLVLLIGTLIFLYREHYIIGIAMTIYSLFAILVLWKTNSSNSSKWVKYNEANAQYYSHISEKFDGTKIISSNNSKSFILGKYKEMVSRLYPVVKAANMTWSKVWGASISIFTFGTVVSLGVGIFLWQKSLISVATIYLFYNYTELLRRPIEQLRVQLQSMQLAGASYKRINQLFSVEYTDTSKGETFRCDAPPSLHISDLSFSYDGDKDVLKNVSFNLNSGESLGVIGRTGSGKSTLINLIMRFYDIGSGDILINGENIWRYKIDDLYKYITYIPQEVEIFDSTLRENIRLFDPAVEDSTIIQVVNQLKFQGWLSKFKGGLDTVISKNNLVLSSGEKQILAFVRAFVSNKKLIIFDEATSNIDPNTESMIENGLEKAFHEATTILIAHKLESLSKVDNIMILHEGKVIEYGSRTQLLSKTDSIYSSLVNGDEPYWGMEI